MKEIRAPSAPAPVGPYSQAVRHAGLLFVSGQIPLDSKTNTLVEGDIEAQAEQALANLSAVLEAGGSSLQRVLRTTVYLVDLGLFARVNAIYARHFTGAPPPARATVQVAALPLGAQIEIDAIACAEDRP
jgi:2-iminobutanoate/2-iminopropanoate deaminase